MPRLDIYLNRALLVQIRLEDKPCRLGRGDECTLALAQPEISRVHAEIRPVEDGYEIENFGKNGTRVNAAMLLGPTRLAFGDRIYIGEYALIFQADDAPPHADNLHFTLTTREVPIYEIE